MIPLNPQLCELMEAALHYEQESNYLKTLSGFAIQIMQWTNSVYQRNHHSWTDEKIRMYVSRTSRYAHINQAFMAIQNGNPSRELVAIALQDSIFLYNEINSEYTPEWDRANSERRTEILEDMLMPHMLFIRFLEKYKK